VIADRFVPLERRRLALIWILLNNSRFGGNGRCVMIKAAAYLAHARPPDNRTDQRSLVATFTEQFAAASVAVVMDQQRLTRSSSHVAPFMHVVDVETTFQSSELRTGRSTRSTMAERR